MSSSLFFIQIGFVVLTVTYFLLLIRELHGAITRASLSTVQKKRLPVWIGLALAAWALFVSGWSLSGIMADFRKFPLNAAPVLAVPLVASIIFIFSKTFSEVVRHIPAERLLYLQSFRVFVELLLWGLFVAEALPVQMTFEGRNFDILVGLTGPVVGYLATRRKIGRTVLVLWNVAGLVLLANIVIVAILSMPTPFRVFTNEPANTIVTHFPISWLPGLLVPLAYTLHFLSLRQLLQKNL